MQKSRKRRRRRKKKKNKNRKRRRQKKRRKQLEGIEVVCNEVEDKEVKENGIEVIEAENGV